MLKFPGKSPFYLHFGEKVLSVSPNFRVKIGEELIASVEALVGKKAIEFG